MQRKSIIICDMNNWKLIETCLLMFWTNCDRYGNVRYNAHQNADCLIRIWSESGQCYSTTLGSLYFSLSSMITTDKIMPLSYSFIRIALCHPPLCFSLISRNHGPFPEHSYRLPFLWFPLVPTLRIPLRHSSSLSDHDSLFILAIWAMTYLPLLSVIAFLLWLGLCTLSFTI